jgi:hypothetical protein
MVRLFALSALLVACGSDPLDDDSGSGGSGGTGGGSGGSGGGLRCADAPVDRDVCASGPGYDDGSAGISAGSVRATVVDTDGEPLSDLMVFICGTDVCSMPEFTGPDGSVTIAYGVPMAKPAFKYGDGLEVGRFFPLLAESTTETDLGTIATPRLPEPGACLAAGAVHESGGVELTLESDAMVELPPIDYPSPDEGTFRAAELPIELAPAGLDAGVGLEAIFALAPTGAVVCPPATVTLPNTPGYAPDTEVDLLIHGVDVDEEWAPYGGWVTVATGRVDAAGERIDTVEGGLPMITNVGVRAR